MNTDETSKKLKKYITEFNIYAHDESLRTANIFANCTQLINAMHLDTLQHLYELQQKTMENINRMLNQ